MTHDTGELIILVAGGRNYFNKTAVFEALDRLHAATPVTKVVHGNASGADTLGGRWAADRGIACTPYPPSRKLDGPGRDWKFRRNERMLHHARPHLVITFPGGPGTQHMVKTARNADYQIWDLRPGPAQQPLPELAVTAA